MQLCLGQAWGIFLKKCSQSVEEAERQDADQEAARGQVAQLELSVKAESGHHLGMRSGAHLEPSPQKRGHGSDDY